MSQTISSTVTYGVVLTPDGTNPLTVTNTGTIAPPSGTVGVYGSAGAPAGGWQVFDAGAIISTGTDGVRLDGQGTVTVSGTVSGATAAIRFNGSYADRVVLGASAVVTGAVVGGTGTNTLELAAGDAGTLTNFSSFQSFNALQVDGGASWTLAAAGSVGAGVAITDAGTLTNLGAVNSTVTLAPGSGLFRNNLSGTIAVATGPGVLGATAQAQVTNDGALSGGGYGVGLLAGGTVTNFGSINAVGTTLAVGVGMRGQSGFVDNNVLSTISATAYSTSGVAAAVALAAGGTLNNNGGLRASGRFASGLYVGGAEGTVTNTGTVVADGAGFQLAAGGTITNTGTVQGTGAGVLANPQAGMTSSGTADLSVTIDNNSGTIQGTGTASAGVFLGNARGAISNKSVISGSRYGVYLARGGFISNDATGTIAQTSANSGGAYPAGIAAYASAIIDNAGTITGTTNGVLLSKGGRVTNTGGLIAQTDASSTRSFAAAIDMTGGDGTVVAQGGTISGPQRAIRFAGAHDDRVVLYGAAVVQGAVVGGTGTNTLELAGTQAGTVTNFSAQFQSFGTVAVDANASWTLAGGGETVAAGITLGGSDATAGVLTLAETGTLVLSGSLSGAGRLVQAGPGLTQLTATNSTSGPIVLRGGTLELAAAGAAGTGRIRFLNAAAGTTLQIDAAAGPAPGGTFGNMIVDFSGDNDVIDLRGVAFQAGATATDDGSTLTLKEVDGTTYTFNLLSSTSAQPRTEYVYDDGAGGTVITSAASYVAPVCFCTGTRILTARGEVAVEDLRVGDGAVTASGQHRPVRWIGRQAVDCSKHPRPHEVMPVRVQAGALGEGRPARDLWVSPGHALALDMLGEVLVPASSLVNGATVAQVDVPSITYWHVELDAHDVLLADGQPAESYIDTGNRAFFGTGEGALDPERSPGTLADYGRPFHDAGPLVAAARMQLRTRAQALGWRLSGEPLGGLHLVCDGARVEAEADGLSARFAVPAGARDVWLCSEAGVPLHGADDAHADRRRLGLCVARIGIDDSLTGTRTVGHDDALLAEGWHAPEANHRWTDGRARLPSELWAGCRGLVFLRVDLAGPAVLRWAAPDGSALSEAPATGRMQRGPRLVHAA